MQNREPIIEIRDLVAGYGDAPVLQDVTLSLARGELGALIGPNGAGKSTLLKLIAGLLKPESGTLTCRATKMGYVPQQAPMDPSLPLTVGEFLALKACRRRFWFGGVGRGELPAIQRALDEIGALHLIHRRLGRLSGGEMQRVLIAYSLMNEPDLLLLDEPLTGVDVQGGLTFDGLLHHLHEHRRMSILMVSHDLHLVEHISDKVFCINGTLCSEGPPREVLRPENLARAYGHLPGRVRAVGEEAFFPVGKIR